MADNENTPLDNEQAALLLGVSPATVAWKIKQEELVANPTVVDLREYQASKARATRGDGRRQYYVRLNDAEAAELVEQGLTVIDPRVKEQERADKARAQAREDIAAMGIEL